MIELFFKRESGKNNATSSRKAERNLDRLNSKSGTYATNLSKSLATSAGYAFLDMTPALKDTIDENVDAIKDISEKYRSMGDNSEDTFAKSSLSLDKVTKGSIRAIQTIISQSNRQVKSDSSKNIKDLGIEIDENKFSFKGIESDSISDKDTETHVESNVIQIESSSKSVASLSNIIAGSVVSLINVNKSGFDSILDGLQNSAENNVTFYEDTLESLNQLQKNMNVLARSSVSRTMQEGTTSTAMEEMLMGNLSIANFMNVVKDNTSMGAMTSNSMKKMAIEKLISSDKIPSFVKNIIDLPMQFGLGMFDYINEESINDSKLFTSLRKFALDRDEGVISSTILSIVGDGEDNKGIAPALRKFLIGKGLQVGGLDTSNVVDKRAKVDFDAESHNSLNVVIPGYLARILASISGSEDLLVNDYKSGKWITATSARDSYDRKVKDTITSNSRFKRTFDDLSTDDEKFSTNDFSDVLYKATMDPNFKVEDLQNMDNPKAGSLYELLSSSEHGTEDFRRALTSSRAEVSKMNKDNTISGSLMNAFNDKDIDNVFDKFTLGAKVQSDRKIDKLEETNSLFKELFDRMSGFRQSIPDKIGKAKEGTSSSEPSKGGDSIISDNGPEVQSSSLNSDKVEEFISKGTEKKNDESESLLPTGSSASSSDSIFEKIGNSISENSESSSVDLTGSLTDKVVNSVKNRVPGLENIDLTGMSERLGKMETGFKEFGPNFSDTINRLMGGRKVASKDGMSHIASNLASTVMDLGKNFSTSSAGMTVTKVLKTVAAPQFLVPALLGGAAIGGVTKLFKNRKSQQEDDGFSEEEENSRGFLSNLALTLVGGVGSVFQGIGNLFSKDDPTVEAGETGDINSNASLSQDVAQESNDDSEILGKDMEESFFADDGESDTDVAKDLISPSSSFEKDFKEQATLSDSAINGEELPEVQKSSILPSLDMDNPLGRLLGTTLPGKLMSKMSSGGLGIKGILSTLSPVMRAKASGLDDSEIEPHDPLDGVTEEMDQLTDGNDAFQMFKSKPGDMAKKLFAFSPLGAAYMMAKRGYDAEDPTSSVKESVKGFFENLSDLMKITAVSASGGGSSGSSSGGSSSIPSASGLKGSNQQKFWDYFTSAGYSEAAVAGMMGNIQQESGFSSDLLERGGGGGYGLIQWTDTPGSPRRTVMENWIKANGGQPSDFGAQLEYLNYEMSNTGNWMAKNPQGQGTYPFEEFKTTNDVEFATKAFCWGYERPAPSKANIQGRIKWAHDFYKEYAGKSSASKSSKDKSSASASANGRILDESGAIVVSSSQGTNRGKTASERGTSSSSSGSNRPANPTEMDKVRVSSPYGKRPSPTPGASTWHWAVDLASGGVNLPIYATQGGVVQSVGSRSGGNIIVIKHTDDNFWSRYIHNEAVYVKKGDVVTKGQTIALMGTTGISTGIHLHFAVSTDGSWGSNADPGGTVDPLDYLDGAVDAGNPNMSAEASLSNAVDLANFIERERPKYLWDPSDEDLEAVYQRTKTKYFDIFGYNEDGSRKEAVYKPTGNEGFLDPTTGRRARASALAPTQSDSYFGTSSIVRPPTSSGSKPPSSVIDKNTGEIVDKDGNRYHIDGNGNLVDRHGNPAVGSSIINVVNKYYMGDNEEESIANLIDLHMGRYYDINVESLDNLDELLRSTRNIGDSTRLILERVISMVQELENQNNLVETNNDKSVITNELLESLKIFLVNVVQDSSGTHDGSGNNGSNGNPIAGRFADNFDFEMTDNELVSLILAGG